MQFAQAVGLCYYFPNDTRRNRVVHVEALRDGSPAGLFFVKYTRRFPSRVSDIKHPCFRPQKEFESALTIQKRMCN